MVNNNVVGPKETQENIANTLIDSIHNANIGSSNIKRSDCCVFIPGENEICGCGLHKRDHKQNLLEKYSKTLKELPQKWDPLTCTCEEIDTDAYGEIRFNNQEKTSKFIRVAENTDIVKITQILFETWSLEPPQLLISVTGGAINFNLKAKLKDAFRRGLLKAALSTNAWIASAGNNVGVMKYVGEAVANASLDPNKKLVVLGITNWTTITNRDLLIKKSLDENEIFDYDTSREHSGAGNKHAHLDQNHSHFILVDNSKLNEFGSELVFRARLEKELSTTYKVPIVVLVLEGGERTILNVLKSVKNGSPCVFIEGSGGCADFFSYVLSKIDEKSSTTTLSDSLRNDFTNKCKLTWPKKNPTQIINYLEEIIKYPNLLSIFRLDSTKKQNEIDVAILKSLLKTQSDNSIGQLKLALDWNRIDIAKYFIFTEDKIWKEGSLNNVMYSAIVNDKVDFFEFFLQNDCDINTFLTYRRLIKLYNDIPESCLLYRRLVKNKRLRHKLYDPNNITFKFKEIGTFVQEISDKLYTHNFTENPLVSIKTQHINDLLAQTDDFGNPKNRHKQTVKDPRAFDFDTRCKNPHHELFMYCILTGRSEMAKLFWNCSNEITSALVASKIFKEYDNLVADDEENYVESIHEYEKMAVDVLQSCYEQDQEDAQLTVLRQVPEYENLTALIMASSFESKNFISTSCFQLILAKLWHGQIFTDAPRINLILALFLPLFAPLFLNLNSDKHKFNFELMNAQAEQEINSKEAFSRGTKTDPNSNKEFNDLMDKKKSKISYWSKIYYFFRSPIVKFFYNQIFFVLFLLLFSYVVLCNFFPIKHLNENAIEIGRDISWTEILLMAWIGAFVLDEIQLLYDIKKYREITIRSFFTDLWNVVQFISIILFIIGFVLRFIPNLQTYLAARIILSIDILLWYFLSLRGYSVFRSLGPKLVMIRRMLNELAVFILIVIVFIFAYGVSTQSLMYHNQELNFSLLKNVFFGAYFVIGGEYFEREKMFEIDKCEDENASTILNTDIYTQENCPEKYGTNVSLALLVGYIMMLNILLVNLLIAIFSNAYEDIQSESDKIWKFQRYKLVSEYFYRPFLPVPFTVFYYVFAITRKILRLLFARCLNIKAQKRIDFYESAKVLIRFGSPLLGPSETSRLKSWESFIAEDYLNKRDMQEKNGQEYRIQKNAEKIDNLHGRIEKMNEIQGKLATKIKTMDEKLDSILTLLSKK